MRPTGGAQFLVANWWWFVSIRGWGEGGGEGGGGGNDVLALIRHAGS